MAIWISRYSNKELQSGKYYPVGISIGTPKFPLGYTLRKQCYSLAPKGYMLNMELDRFKPAYYEKLEGIGTDRIIDMVEKMNAEARAEGKELVLLCYEDVRVRHRLSLFRLDTVLDSSLHCLFPAVKPGNDLIQSHHPADHSRPFRYWVAGLLVYPPGNELSNPRVCVRVAGGSYIRLYTGICTVSRQHIKELVLAKVRQLVKSYHREL